MNPGSVHINMGTLSQAEDPLEHKFQSLWEEITRIRWQSQTQIQCLTDEIKRLKKETQEQQEKILNLMEENVQIRQQLSASMTTESLNALNFVDDGGSSKSDSTIDVANTAYRRVSDLILIFENKQNVKSILENSEMTNTQQHKHLASKYDGRKQLISDYASSYTNSINSSRNSSTDKLNEAVNQPSYHRVSELRAVFETGALNEQRVKSSLDIPDLAYHQQHGELHDEYDSMTQAITVSISLDQLQQETFLSEASLTVGGK